MKHFSLTLALIISLTLVMAQPYAFKYQAVVRDAGGVVIANQSITFRISILQGSVGGTVVYTEDHSTSTNEFGLANLEIGNGTPIFGIFSVISWGSTDHYIEISIDLSGGTNFTFMGASQVLTVPYALYAETARKIEGSVGPNIYPPYVIATPATNIESFSAAINGLVNAEGFITTVIFEWGETSEYGNTIAAQQSPVKGSSDEVVSANLSNLQPANNYNYRIIASNAVDIIVSEDMSFITALSTPQITTNEVNAIQALSAKCGGNITYNGGSPVTARGIVWSISENPTTDDYFSIDGDGIGSYLSEMTDLNHATTYFVRAYATNAVGTSYGNQISFSTQNGIISLTTSEIVEITLNSAKCGGYIINDGGDSVISRGVVWSTFVNPTLNDYEGITFDGTGIGEFVSLLSDLNPLTLYYIRSYAINNIGINYGNQLNFTTFYIDGYPCPGADTVLDINGNIYTTLAIGNQCWMKENLKTTTYNNGLPIPNVADDSAWEILTTGAYVYYENDTNWKDKYGLLYNWHAAVDTNGLCPEGWHVPTNDEWILLSDYIDELGLFSGNVLKSCRQINSPLSVGCNTTEHPRWEEDTWNGNYGTDDYGFSGLPGGYRGYSGAFDNIGFDGHWWSSTELSPLNPYAWISYLSFGSHLISDDINNKYYGYSVRCLQGEITIPLYYNLSLIVNPCDAGLTNGTGPYTSGDQINISLEVYYGWEFINWTNEDNIEVSTDASFIYTMPANNAILTANFVQNQVDFVCGLSKLTDLDCNAYNTILIGNQCWMKENLKVTKLPSGSSAYRSCYQDYVNNCNLYGGLYWWAIIMNGANSSNNNPSGVQGICPIGWHIPSIAEWTQLLDHLSNQGFPNNNVPSGAGNALKSCRQVNSPLGGDCNTSEHPRWNSWSTSYGFDEFYFSALPGGSRDYYGYYENLGAEGAWWSSTEHSSTDANYYFLNYSIPYMINSDISKLNLLSVRCIRD